MYLRAGSGDVLIHNCNDLNRDEVPGDPNALGHTIDDHVATTSKRARAEAAAESAKQKNPLS